MKSLRTEKAKSVKEKKKLTVKVKRALKSAAVGRHSPSVAHCVQKRLKTRGRPVVAADLWAKEGKLGPFEVKLRDLLLLLIPPVLNVCSCGF